MQYSICTAEALATGWTTEELEFESRYGLHIIQTGPGVHPTPYPVGTGGSFPGE
jgi:hypothetical protein